MQSEIAAVRALGGDVMVSFGGAANLELAQAITNVAALPSAQAVRLPDGVDYAEGARVGKDHDFAKRKRR